MLYGGSLSTRLRSRDDASIECCDVNLDHRLPTSARGSVATDPLVDVGRRWSSPSSRNSTETSSRAPM